ncbi:hypothetical protein [Arthrobacter sp. NamB2]|uniref:hypothetical protein n=1 Tax=Arthrobacter sp. NamB2 TaxID=2576035 RepID=UPI00167C4248|nr:hypothetical protein [Arthrobacter sp. NamB2]
MGPYPHVQHIHGGALSQCPTPAKDANGDGIVSVIEAADLYSAIQTTVTTSGATTPTEGLNLEPGGQGGTYSVQSEITFDAATKASLESETAAVVVHGLDPAPLACPRTSSTRRAT